MNKEIQIIGQENGYWTQYVRTHYDSHIETIYGNCVTYQIDWRFDSIVSYQTIIDKACDTIDNNELAICKTLKSLLLDQLYVRSFTTPYVIVSCQCCKS